MSIRDLFQIHLKDPKLLDGSVLELRYSTQYNTETLQHYAPPQLALIMYKNKQ